MTIRFSGSGSCCVKIKVYDYMAQPDPDQFINWVEVVDPL